MSDMSHSVSIVSKAVEDCHSYIAYAEDAGFPDRTKSDGYSLYRGLSRQIVGDPRRRQDIRMAVLQFFIRVRTNLQHPLHGQLSGRERRFEMGTSQTFFAFLDSPDLAPSEHILWVISKALSVNIVTFLKIDTKGKLAGQTRTVGDPGLPVLRFLEKHGKDGMASRFSSLLRDESGRALVEYLQSYRRARDARKSSPQPKADVKQISWAWEQEHFRSGYDISCYNEYRQDSRKEDLVYSDSLNRMDSFVVTISKPQDIRPALDLFKEVLKRAPNQCRTVRSSATCDLRTMLPHCSTDSEFIKLPRETAQKWEDDPEVIADLIATGDLDEICSVLTFAVGRTFFLLVNIDYMLQTATKHTVPALEELYRETIFNPELIKLWWNPGSDYKVKHDTIAQMYQASPRPAETRYRWSDDRVFTVHPQYHYRSPHFSGERPKDLQWPTGQVECEIHQDERNKPDSSCYCRLGNVDMGSLLNHVCRTHGLNMYKGQQGDARYRFIYHDLLAATLSTDRLWPLMEWMKNCATYRSGSLLSFYQSLGQPGMEMDGLAMSYNIGDVAGLNLIFEQLFSDDKRFIGGVLHAYHHGRGETKPWLRPARKIKQHCAGNCEGIPLYVDNPKSFIDTPFAKLDGKDGLTAVYSWQNEVAGANGLAPWKHDRQALQLRKVETKHSRFQPLHPQLYESPLLDPQNPSDYWYQTDRLLAINPAMKHLVDPSRIWLPRRMVLDVGSEYEKPVVRTGSTHAEALLDLLRSPMAANSTCPPGFGAPVGHSDGLPAPLQRVPGGGLELARDLFEAFIHKPVYGGDHLGPVLSPAKAPTAHHPFDEQSIFDATIDRFRDYTDGNVWEAMKMAQEQVERMMEIEAPANASHGRPHIVDVHDQIDVEGRDFRRRAEAAEEWNRPVLEVPYEMGEAGRWKSLLTVQHEILSKRLKELSADSAVQGQWEVPLSKKMKHKRR